MAYNRIRWSFLYDTLIEASFPSSFVAVIMKCICFASMQLLWNGNVTKAFIPMRGSGLSDPLTLFICVMYRKIDI